MGMGVKILLAVVCFCFFFRMTILWDKNQKLIENYWIKNTLPFLNKEEEYIINKYKNYYRGFTISGFVLGMILFLDL